MMKRLLLIGLCAMALLGVAGCQNQLANVEGSRDAAERWVAAVLPGYEMVGFSSATLDTDEDGYVTAEVTVRKKGDPNAPLKLVQLQCPTKGILMKLEKGGNAKLAAMPFDNSF